MIVDKSGEYKTDYIEKDIEYDSIPTMIGSKYCHLYKMSENELIEAGEDPNDPFGYYIIKGTEKTIDGKEELRNNMPIISLKNEIPELRRTFKVRNGSQVMLITLGKKLKTIKCKLNFTPIKNKIKKSIPVFIVYLYLFRKKLLLTRKKNYTLRMEDVLKKFNIKDIINDIMKFVKNDEEKNKIHFNLTSSIAKFDTYVLTGISITLKNKLNLDKTDLDKIDDDITEKIYDDLYPLSEDDLDINDKNFYLNKLDRQYLLLCSVCHLR